jgi:hypothetical protein
VENVEAPEDAAVEMVEREYSTLHSLTLLACVYGAGRMYCSVGGGLRGSLVV